MTAKVFAAGVAVLLAFGCSDPPTIPTALDTPSFTVTRDAWVETLDFTGWVAYVGCVNDGAGDWLEWSGTIDAHFWSRTTPSGNEVTNCQVDYYTDTPFSAVGASGDVWNLFRGEDNCNYMGKSGAPKFVVDHFQASEWYVNQDGEKFRLQNSFKIQRDNDGNVKMRRYVETYRCTGTP